MVNFLSLLGWSLDDKSEIFSIGELIESFSIERVSKSPAIFNIEKLDWMNGLYIRDSNSRDLVVALNEYWKSSSDPQFDREPDRKTLTRIIPLIQERIKNLSEAAALIRFFFASDLKYESGELIQKKMDVRSSLVALESTVTTLKQTKPFDAASIENDLRGLTDELNIKPGQLFGALRIATTGQRISPPLFESIEVLGKELTLGYIQNAIRKLRSLESED
jgi:glutamyl-tRNA synthetase